MLDTGGGSGATMEGGLSLRSERGRQGCGRRAGVVGVVFGLALVTSVAFGHSLTEGEPNDSVATGTPILAPGVPKGVRSGTIDAPGDADFYSAAVRAGDVLVVFADRDPEGDGAVTDLVVALLAPDGVTGLLTAHSPPTGD